jgi:hypothetical protein
MFKDLMANVNVAMFVVGVSKSLTLRVTRGHAPALARFAVHPRVEAQRQVA